MDVKHQLFQGTTNEADFRGEKALGKDTDPIDRHSTTVEFRLPDELADEAVERLGALNAHIEEELAWLTENATASKVSEAIGTFFLHGEGPIRQAFRVYNND